MANGGIIGKVNNPTSTTATGVWQQEEQYEAKVTDTWPQRALFTTKSLRFNDPSNDYLNRTPSSAGNRKTWTFSCWVKRGLLSGSSSYGLFGGGDGAGNPRMYCQFDDDTIILDQNSTGNTWGNERLITNRLFRDVSAWYHIVIVLDTTQGTASNRQKIYVNGVQETSFSTAAYPSQNTDMPFNNNVASSVGSIGGTSSNIFDGYMAEVCFIDGTALDPTSFGVANSDGVWTPIPYTGTFGNNGFNLQFENSAALGTDSSPNGNTFTVNNLTSIDQSTDYPVVNYSTFNPLSKNDAGTVTFSNGNLTVAHSGSDSRYAAYSAIGAANGKWYMEIKIDAMSGTDVIVGVGSNVEEINRLGTYYGTGSDPTSVGYFASDGDKYIDDVASSYGNSFAVGDIIGIAMDLDNNKLYFSKNGTFQNSGNPTSGATGTGAIALTANLTYFMGASHATTTTRTSTYSGNFGSPSFAISSSNADGNGYGNFEYAVPSGYYALNTANLAEFG
jgi:hypothetical protein